MATPNRSDTFGRLLKAEISSNLSRHAAETIINPPAPDGALAVALSRLSVAEDVQRGSPLTPPGPTIEVGDLTAGPGSTVVAGVIGDVTIDQQQIAPQREPRAANPNTVLLVTVTKVEAQAVFDTFYTFDAGWSCLDGVGQDING